jgi:hypothetical protein
MAMFQKHIHLTKDLIERAELEHKRSGIRLAELIRRGLDQVLKQREFEFELKNKPGREHRCASRRAVSEGNNE